MYCFNIKIIFLQLNLLPPPDLHLSSNRHRRPTFAAGQWFKTPKCLFILYILCRLERDDDQADQAVYEYEYTQEQADLLYGKVLLHSCVPSVVALQCSAATVQGSMVQPGVFTQEDPVVLQRSCIRYNTTPYHTTPHLAIP